MMVQTQKRAYKEYHPQPIAAALNAGLVLPGDARVATEFKFPIPLLTTGSVSQPPGRAPPRLV
jgi:hypothetical protein